MATLHTVNKSPYERATLNSCLSHVQDGDSVLLIEDAVLGSRRGGGYAQTLSTACARSNIYVLGPDLEARGIKKADVVEGVSVVDYDGFVALVEASDRVCGWL